MDPLQAAENEKNIQRFKTKKLIKQLETARGAGTSVITLYIPPKEQIAKVVQMLNIELGTCANIKSHTNKISVQTAITATLGRLKMINRVPPNGLIVYCGTVLTEDNKEKKITMDIEPFKAVSRSLYQCDNKFQTEELHRMLESDDKYGFIIMDGSGTLYATVAGSVKEKLGSFSVELPKKHGRGGQSKNRFARIRMERRHNYVRKVAEMATQYFITADRPNVQGIVLAGSADFKEVLAQSDLFDPRLKAVILKIVDVAHAGDMGLNQAIEMAADTLSGVKLVQEKKLLQKFFDDIARDTGMFCFGVSDTIKCMEMGSLETLILYEDLDLNRYVVTPEGGVPTVYYMTPQEWSKTGHAAATAAAAAAAAAAPEAGAGSQLNIEEDNAVDYWTGNYAKMGFTVELVTNKSQEGTQFQRGFGGIGGTLRYKVDLVQLADLEAQGQKAGAADPENPYDYEDDFM